MLSQQVKGLKIGNLTLAAYVGVPGGKSTLLDTATLTGNAVPAKQSKILFKFPNRPKVTKGTSMYFLIQTTSDIYRYQVWGDGAGKGPDIMFALTATGGWQKFAFSPYAVVQLLACF